MITNHSCTYPSYNRVKTCNETVIIKISFCVNPKVFLKLPVYSKTLDSTKFQRNKTENILSCLKDIKYIAG